MHPYVDILKLALLGLMRPDIQFSLLNICGFQSSLLLTSATGRTGVHTVPKYDTYKTYPICHDPLLRSARSLRHIIRVATIVQLLITETFWWGPLLVK